MSRRLRNQRHDLRNGKREAECAEFFDVERGGDEQAELADAVGLFIGGIIDFARTFCAVGNCDERLCKVGRIDDADNRVFASGKKRRPFFYHLEIKKDVTVAGTINGGRADYGDGQAADEFAGNAFLLEFASAVIGNGRGRGVLGDRRSGGTGSGGGKRADDNNFFKTGIFLRADFKEIARALCVDSVIILRTDGFGEAGKVIYTISGADSLAQAIFLRNLPIKISRIDVF